MCSSDLSDGTSDFSGYEKIPDLCPRQAEREPPETKQRREHRYGEDGAKERHGDSVRAFVVCDARHYRRETEYDGRGDRIHDSAGERAHRFSSLAASPLVGLAFEQRFTVAPDRAGELFERQFAKLCEPPVDLAHVFRAVPFPSVALGSEVR